MENKVVIAWASRKRHLFVDGKLICENTHKGGYSKGGHYCSYDLSGLPKYDKTLADEDYTRNGILTGGGLHTDGIIPFKPLSEIGGIIERSICNKCISKYNKLLENQNK